MAVHCARSSSPAIVVTGRIQNPEPARTAALMVWFRNAGSVISARRFREAAERVKRVDIGSWLKISRRSSVGKALKGSGNREVGNLLNLGVGEATVGEGQLQGNERMHRSNKRDVHVWAHRLPTLEVSEYGR